MHIPLACNNIAFTSKQNAYIYTHLTKYTEIKCSCFCPKCNHTNSTFKKFLLIIEYKNLRGKKADITAELT